MPVLRSRLQLRQDGAAADLLPRRIEPVLARFESQAGATPSTPAQEPVSPRVEVEELDPVCATPVHTLQQRAEPGLYGPVDLAPPAAVQ